VLDSGGHIVKRMGDGMMAVFTEPATAVRATVEALAAVKTVEVQGYTPRMRAGIHTGRPQRIGSDWLGVDVNVAARVMERATRGGLIISGQTLERISAEEMETLGVSAKRVRRQVFAPRQSGVPADLMMYRISADRDQSGEEEADDSAELA
jgi:class 3 adenylate cyclase